MRNKHVQIVEYIVAHYPLTIEDYNNALLYHTHCLYSDISIMRLLINKGANNFNEIVKAIIPTHRAFTEFSPKLNLVLSYTNPSEILNEKIQLHMLNTGYGILLNLNKKLHAYEEAGPYLHHHALLITRMPFIPEISNLIADYLIYELTEHR